MAVTTEQVQVNVEINGTKAGTTMKDLQASAKQLRNELRQLPTDTDEFAKKAAELQKVNTQLKQINDSVKAVDKSMEDAGKTSGFFGNMLSGAMSVFTGGGLLDLAKKALGGIEDFLVSSVNGAKESARSFAQLQQALNGNAEAAKNLADEAENLEKSTSGLFSAEDIKDAQTHLALYTQEADQIKQLTPLITDLAAAKGVDLATAADAVGKSLEGDADGLKKMGISVKDAANEQERFTLITQGLTEKVGGQAGVVAETTKTGWDKLKVMWDDMSKGLGAKLIPIIDTLGNFLVELWNKSQPVVDVFKTIFGVFGQVWDSIKQLIASFGLFSDKASFAETIMKNLSFVLKPLQLVWQGLGLVIKGVSWALNELVAGGYGAVNALVAIFSNFKTFFNNLFSGIGDVIKGVFTLDADKIREGVAGMKSSFTEMGGKIAEAYNQGYNEVKARQKAATANEDEEDHKKEVAKAEQHGKEKGEAKAKGEDDAAKKAREKREADEKKRQEDELKRQADLNNKLLELNRKLEDMKIQAMQDGEEKQIAQENLRYERELAANVNTINDLRKLGATEQEIRDQSRTLDELTEQKHQDNLHDIRLKGWQQTLDEADKTTEKMKQRREQEYKAEIDATNQFYGKFIEAIKQGNVNKINTENLTDEQIKNLHKNTDIAILQAQVLQDEALLAQAKKHGDDTIELQTKLEKDKQDLTQKTTDFTKANQEAVMQTTQEGLDFIIDALSQDEEARKKNANLLKAFNIAKIAIDLEREIQGIWSGVSELGPILGPILGGVQTALAVGRSALAVSKLKSVEYAHGGYTGEDGVSIYSTTGDQVAGVVHTGEWVAPRWMTTHPVYNSYINQLEGIRQRGFANGGFTTTPTIDTLQTENKLDALIQAFKEFPTRLKADVVYTEFETVAQNVNDVRSAARVGT